MVPCDEEEHYDDYVMTLYAQSVLTPNEWLDLGGLLGFLLKQTLVPAFGSSTRVSIPHTKRY